MPAPAAPVVGAVGGEHTDPVNKARVSVHSHPRLDGAPLLICPASGTENSISEPDKTNWEIYLSDGVVLPVTGTKGNSNKGEVALKPFWRLEKRRLYTNVLSQCTTRGCVALQAQLGSP